MFRIENYIEELTAGLKAAFGKRLVYIGLQGSYLRGEQTEHSDIDIMAVIDDLLVEDLKIYRETLTAIGNFEKSCGFLCGKNELAHWNPLEVCHLLHTTKDYYGELKTLVPPYTLEDEKNFVKISLNNLYHEICHRFVHADREKNIAKLPATYKSVFYILQHLHYLRSGEFVQTKQELLERLHSEDKTVLKWCISLKAAADYNFDKAFSALFDWCQSALASI